MKIAFNPSTVAALITPPNNKDITFDLRGHNIFARGVKFCGTDTNTWRDIKINNVSIGSNTLDLRNGSNTTLTNTNGVVTINSTWRPVVDNLTSDSTTSSLSANLGRVLAGLINGKSDSDHNHDDRYLRLTGGWMSGDINFGGDNRICWGRNTDSASISFKNDGDGDADSYMSFVTSDNGNEYFRWSHSSGSTNTEWMALRSDGLRVGGTKVSLEGHSHNDLYYTKTEVNNKLNGKLNYRLFWERTNIDLNSITEAWHTYEVNNGTGTANTPTNASWHQAVLWGTGDTNYAVLLCTAYTSNYSLYLRHKIAGKWNNWIQLATTTDIPSSLKNPYSLTTFGVVYDGSAAKVVSPSNFISLLEEGTSTITDGTMFITSWASDNGFADTNAVNVPYKRKAIHLWEYVKAKTDSLYTVIGHNHDDRYLKLTGGVLKGQIILPDIDVNTSYTGSIIIGASNTENLGIDGNEIMARNNGKASTLYLNNEGGVVQLGAILRTNSNIAYIGSQSTQNMIKFINNTSDPYGNGIAIGGGGLTIIGSGESSDVVMGLHSSGGDENMIIAGDGNIDFYSNLQDGWLYGKHMYLDTNGFLFTPSYINIGGNENNNSSPDRVWGSNGSDSYLRSYRTSALRVAYANSANSTTKVIVTLHIANDVNYPLVWSNQANDSSVTENQLFKSWADLYYNPKNKRLYANNLLTGVLLTTDNHYYRFDSDSTLRIYANSNSDPERIYFLAGIDNRIDDYDIPSYGGELRHSIILNPRGGFVGIGDTNPSYKLSVGGDTKITGSIRSLAIGGGIYWNPYVESTTDGSDSASITLVRLGVAGGTTLVLSLMNDANDTILFQTNGSARLYHNSYPILTTLNTYVNNNKGYINGTEITLVNNSDTLDGHHETYFMRNLGVMGSDWNDNITAGCYKVQNPSKNTPGNYNFGMGLTLATENHNDGENRICQIYFSHNHDYAMAVRTHNNPSGFAQDGSDWTSWALVPTTTGNIASATKLLTARKLWGLSFDGTSDVNGTIYINNSDSSNGAIRLNNNVNSNARISAISDQVIFNTGNAIRFGETSWDWNQWAGLKYTHSNKTIYLGIADGSTFTANSALSGGTLNLRAGISNIDLNSGISIRGLPTDGSPYSSRVTLNDTYISLSAYGDISMSTGSGAINLSSGYSGIKLSCYGNNASISPEGFKVEASRGAYLNSGNSGNVYLCLGGGKVGIGTTAPSYKLDVNGLIRASGFIHSDHSINDAVLLAGGGYGRIFKLGTTRYYNNTSYELSFHKLSGLCNNLVWVDGCIWNSTSTSFLISSDFYPYLYANSPSMRTIYRMDGNNMITVDGNGIVVISCSSYPRRIGFFYTGRA